MQACAKEPFSIDWSAFFTVHDLDPLVSPITSSTWVVVGGVEGSSFVTGAKTGVFLSGGTAGGKITATNTIEINGGEYRDCRTLIIGVK